MKQYALVGLLVVLAVSVVPTGAIPFDGSTDTIGETGQQLHLAPANGTNGTYATLRNETTLSIEARGVVHPGETKRIDDVFVVGYEGDTNATVWIEDGSENVTFVVTSGQYDGRRIESPETAPTLQPGDQLSIGFRVDATGAQPGEALLQSIRVYSRFANESSVSTGAGPVESADQTTTETESIVIDLTPVSESASESTSVPRTGLVSAESGQTVTVKTGDQTPPIPDVRMVSIQFTATENLDFEARAEQSRTPCNDDAEDPVPTQRGGLHYFCFEHPDGVSESVSETTLTFEVEQSALDRWNVSANDLEWYRHDGGEWTELDSELTGRNGDVYEYDVASPGLSVYAISTPKTGIRVTDAWTEEKRVEPGASVTVNALVEQRGDDETNGTLRLRTNETVLATQNVSVQEGTVVRRQFVHSFDEAGTYRLRVNGVDAGTVRVGSNETSSDLSGAADRFTSPGASLIAGPLAGGIGALIWAHRNY